MEHKHEQGESHRDGGGIMSNWMKKIILVFFVLFWAFVPAWATAGVIVQSTFDSGDEGWTVGDFFAATGASTPFYVATGGNPGGFIRTTDMYSWNGYHAPVAFLGDKSAAYGGVLHVEQRLLTSDNAAYPMVVISDGSTSLQFRTTPPGTGWTSYDIGLTASAGWEIMNTGGGSGAAATESQLQTVLSNLVFMNFQGDWQTGSDQVDLDNVSLNTPVPVPASILLLAPGLAGLAVMRRRFKK